MRLRLDLAYDGTGFSGYARQRGPDGLDVVRTVQGVLEDALQRLAGTAVETTCAGRTDAGVHAVGQVVSLDVAADSRVALDPARTRTALDRLVGPKVTVWSVTPVDSTFDARFSATLRRYRYRLADGAAIEPLQRHHTFHAGPPSLDVAAMRDGARHLLGEHDFSAFCRRAGDQHLVRRIDVLDVARDGDVVTLDVAGPAFCHQMVRSIVGCLLRVGRGRLGPGAVADVLASRDRSRAGAVAPPHGLTLTGVDYG